MKAVAGMIGCVLSATCSVLAADKLVENFRYGTDDGTGTSADVSFFEPDAAALDKTGAGERTVPLSSLRGFGPATVQALDGTLTVADDGTLPAESAEAPAAAQKAAVWLDASANLTVGGEGVVRWYDRREEKSGDDWGTAHYAGVSLTSGSLHPTVRQNEQGADMLYFNGYTSGSYMKFLKPDRTGNVYELGDVRHIYMVHRIVSTYGTLLGNASYPYFTCGNPDAPMTSTYLMATGNATSYAAGGRFYVNGADVDVYATTVRTGLQLFEWVGSRVNVAQFGGFFFQGGSPAAKRCGGDDLGEVLIFTNLLTSVERTDVERYLMKKWQIASAQPKMTLRAAKGATVKLDVGADGVMSGPLHYGVTGAGSAEKTGAGDLSLGERYGDGALAPLHIGAGRVIDYSGTVPVAPQDGENYALTASLAADPVLTKSSGTAGSVSLSGSAGYALHALPAGTSQLTVTGESLALRGGDADYRGAPLAGAVEATIPNPTFESGTSGWTSKSYSGTYFTTATLPDSGNWLVQNTYPAPQGSKVLVTRYNFEATTPITVPVDGRYELSFATCARGTSANRYMQWMDVGIITDGQTNIISRCHPSNKYGFIYNRYRTPKLAAGSTHKLYLAYLGGEEAIHLIDDFRLRRITDETDEVVPVPNGNFEQVNLVKSYGTEAYNDANTLTGWTLEQSETGATAPWSAAPATINMTAYYRGDKVPYGETQLALLSNGGRATSAAFTLPAGKWRLRCRAVARKSGSDLMKWHTLYLQGDPVLSVSAKVGNADVDLGAVKVSRATTSVVTLPTAIKSTGTEPVTVSLTQTLSNGALFVDDLEFVRDEELVTGGVIETGSDAWTYTSHNDAAVDMLKNSGASAMNLTASWAGYATCAGTKAVRIVQCGEMSQTVDFPEAGTYRLSLWTRPRAAATGTSPIHQGGNIVQASIRSGDKTLVIGRTAHVFSTNFVRHVFYFNVPKKGEWTFSIRGCNGLPTGDGSYEVAVPSGFHEKDASAFVDGISIVRAPHLGAAPAGLENATVVLGEKTRLHLDFDGDVKLESIRIGGRKHSGWIDHESYPDLVFGPGRAFVEPKGLSLILR